MSVYARNAGPTLMGLMATAAEASQREHDLTEEIKLVRATLARTVVLWNQALENTNNEELKLRCEMLVRECAASVAQIVQASARARATDAGCIQLTSVSWVVGEVTRAVEEVVRDRDPEMAQALVDRIGRIKLPEDGDLRQFTRQQASEEFL